MTAAASSEEKVSERKKMFVRLETEGTKGYGELENALKERGYADAGSFLFNGNTSVYLLGPQREIDIHYTTPSGISSALGVKGITRETKNVISIALQYVRPVNVLFNGSHALDMASLIEGEKDEIA